MRSTCTAVIAAGALAAAAPGAAQSSDRYREDLTRTSTIRGLTAAQTAEWTRTFDRVVTLLRAVPDVTNPPDGICTLLSGQTGAFTVDGRMAERVGIQIPLSWDAGSGCSGRSNGAVTVHLNGTGSFIVTRPTELTDEDWDELRVTPRPAGARGSASLWQDQYNRWAVITHGRAPLLDTLTHEQYLRRRITDLQKDGAGMLADQLSARLQAMSADARAAHACFDASDLLGMLGPCGEGGRAHVKLNRAYFDGALPPEAVQLIVVSSPQAVRGKEDARHFALRTRYFEALDYDALAELIRR